MGVREFKVKNRNLPGYLVLREDQDSGVENKNHLFIFGERHSQVRVDSEHEPGSEEQR